MIEAIKSWWRRRHPKMLVYSNQRWWLGTQLAVGLKQEVLTSPPLTSEAFEGEWLENKDFIWIKLHGLEGSPAWYGEDSQRQWIEAFSAKSFLIPSKGREADLRETIVFLENCWAKTSPLVDEFMVHGAAAVVGATGINWVGSALPLGTDTLGWLFLNGLKGGLTVKQSLEMLLKLPIEDWKDFDYVGNGEARL